MKQKLINSRKSNLSLSYQSRKVDIDCAFYPELISSIASMTGWLFKTVQKVFTPEKQVHLSLYALKCFKYNLKADVKVLDTGLTAKYFGAAITYLDLLGRLRSFGSQYRCIYKFFILTRKIQVRFFSRIAYLFLTTFVLVSKT